MTNTREEMAIAEALFELEKQTMGDAWYHPSETFKGLGESSQQPWILSARTAIAASNSKYVPMLVEVIKRSIARLMIDATGAKCSTQRRLNTIAILFEALNNLPEELRG